MEIQRTPAFDRDVDKEVGQEPLLDRVIRRQGWMDRTAGEGEVVTCPWHGSRFNVCSGHVKGGPATFSQPPLIAREQNGRVEVKLAHPLH